MGDSPYGYARRQSRKRRKQMQADFTKEFQLDEEKGRTNGKSQKRK